MLEKTAVASFECRSLNRIFGTSGSGQAATAARPTSRRLHTAFWQHGASAFEISTGLLAGRAARRAARGAAAGGSGSRLEDATGSSRVSFPVMLNASSSFLFDFLYPQASLVYLRRHMPTSRDLLHPHQTPSSGREFTTSVPRLKVRKQKTTEERLLKKESKLEEPEAMSDAKKDHSSPAEGATPPNEDEAPNKDNFPNDGEAPNKNNSPNKDEAPNMDNSPNKDKSRTDRQNQDGEPQVREETPKRPNHNEPTDGPLDGLQWQTAENIPPVSKVVQESRQESDGASPKDESETMLVVSYSDEHHVHPVPITTVLDHPSHVGPDHHVHSVPTTTVLDHPHPSHVGPDEEFDRPPPVDVLLRRLLDENEAPDCNKAWLLYDAMDASLQRGFTADMIAYLSRSDGLANQQRAISLFDTLRPEEWSPSSVEGTIRADLARCLHFRAEDTFRRSLSEPPQSFMAGFDLLLKHALTVRDWWATCRVWRLYWPKRDRWPHALEPVLCEVRGLDEVAVHLASFLAAQANLAFLPVDTLVQLLARLAVKQGKGYKAAKLLSLTQSEECYRMHILRAAELEQYTDFPQIFKAYRTFPGYRIDPPMMKALFPGLYPRDLVGLRNLYRDFLKHNGGKLDSWSYNKYLKLHAANGDVERVHDLWEQWTTEHTEWEGLPILTTPRTFGHLINVHASRGDAVMARRAFDEVQSMYSIVPTVDLWNILLKAETRTNQYHQAIETFNALCQAVEPDQHSFGTIMGIAGSFGDLDFVMELFKMARAMDIPATVYMVAAIVEACCNNDRFADAERVCQSGVTNFGIRQAMPWNKLLRFMAARRDLTGCYKLLKRMSENEVAWDDDTYEQLLRVLVNARQTHHAYHMLRLGYKDRIFNVTPEHFAIVMAGGLKSGDVMLARNLAFRQRWAGIDITLNTHLMLVDAMYRILRDNHNRKERARDDDDHYYDDNDNNSDSSSSRLSPNDSAAWQQRTRFFGRQLVSHLRKAKLHGAQNVLDRRPGGALRKPGDERQVALNPRLISRVVFVLAQLRDFVSVRELMELYGEMLPMRDSDDWNIPIEVLSSLMVADFLDARYARMRNTWERIFSMAITDSASVTDANANANTDTGTNTDTDGDGDGGGSGGSSSRRATILPAKRYILSVPLKTMMTMHVATRSPRGLQQIVERVRAAGFELDSKNWNTYVAGLAKLGRVVEAFKVCEQHLMGGWIPWRIAEKGGLDVKLQRLPVELKRQRLSPRVLCPTLQTMTLLDQSYARLAGAALFSLEDDRTLQGINEECPRTVAACKELRIMGIIDPDMDLWGVGVGPRESASVQDPDGVDDGGGEDGNPWDSLGHSHSHEVAERLDAEARVVVDQLKQQQQQHQQQQS